MDAFRKMMTKDPKVAPESRDTKDSKGQPQRKKGRPNPPREGAKAAKSLFINNILLGKGKVTKCLPTTPDTGQE